MGTDTQVNVDVTISDELRRLLRGESPPADVAPPACRTDQPEMTKDHLEEPPEPEVQPQTQVWRDIMLRRDGDRPLKFKGLRLFEWVGMPEGHRSYAQQTLTLYLGSDKTVYACLVLEPDADAPARPAHQCRPIEDVSAFEAFLNTWQPEACFEPVFGQNPQHLSRHMTIVSAVRSVYETMIAGCLSKRLLQV